VRLLQRGRSRPRAKTIGPAERYLFAGTDEARRLGHNYVGTEHMLRVLVRDPAGSATRLLAALGVSTDAVERALACWPEDSTATATIDPTALATLGIDFEEVRERLEETFGPGALERTRSGCMGVCPRLKMAPAYSLDHASQGSFGEEHVLLGLLSVPDSVAARVLGELGVSLAAAQAALEAG
jgi:ATP-dependent Clp protease ATP-binding subunit ClpA